MFISFLNFLFFVFLIFSNQSFSADTLIIAAWNRVKKNKNLKNILLLSQTDNQMV